MWAAIGFERFLSARRAWEVRRQRQQPEVLEPEADWSLEEEGVVRLPYACTLIRTPTKARKCPTVKLKFNPFKCLQAKTISILEPLAVGDIPDVPICARALNPCLRIASLSARFAGTWTS